MAIHLKIKALVRKNGYERFENRSVLRFLRCETVNALHFEQPIMTLGLARRAHMSNHQITVAQPEAPDL